MENFAFVYCNCNWCRFLIVYQLAYKKMAEEERKKVELWAQATMRLSSAGIQTTSPEMDQLNTDYLSFLSFLSTQNTTIPIILVDSEEIINDANISYSEARKDEILAKELRKMKDYSEPIKIEISEEKFQYLYYRESSILRNLRFYPFVQLFVIVVFIAVAYFAFNATQRAEQNQVWVGMSKETAHQLGTPISSLMAWIELLKLKEVDPEIISEFEKDTQRLERITERFSKIGSKPDLLRSNVVEVLASSVNYLKTRSSSKVIFETSFIGNEYIETPLNAALFSWVIENLCKNAKNLLILQKIFAYKKYRSI